MGIPLFQEQNNKVTGHVDLWNLYIPPIHQSDKDYDRQQLFDPIKLPTDPNSFYFVDSNCHGTWDDRLDSNAMADKWEDWLSRNNFGYMNTPDSFTRKDCKGRKSSPDITVAHNSWIGRYSWSPQHRNPGGSDHLPILVTLTLNLPNKRRSRKKKGRARWSGMKGKLAIFQTSG